MQVIETPQQMMRWRRENPAQKIGFVPTMGALHLGHETLMQKARAENDLCVLSIFVNPTQFNDPNDFAKYPKTWEADLEKAKQNGVDVVFAPSKDLMYPDDYRYKVVEMDFSKSLCGADRPGHFDGVLSVVLKLFNVVGPSNAYFGEKDYQQFSLIKGMARAFFLPLEVIPVPTVREADGLAMSSRNLRLSPEDRLRAPRIYQALTQEKTALLAQARLEKDGFKVDYVTERDGRRFAAVRMGEVRLIDNVEIPTP